jgi:hypothetical protein
MGAGVFCDTCHQLVYLRVVDGDKVKLVQGGRTVITTSAKSKLNLKLKCPGGHETAVRIEP